MKLPVFRAIGETFAFVVGNLVQILRIIWAPLLLLGVVQALILPRYLQNVFTLQALAPDADPQQIVETFGAVLPDLLMLIAFALFVYPVVLAGILKLQLRGEKPRLPLYMGFGVEELRLVGTWLLLGLILFGLAMVLGILSGAGRYLASNASGVGAALGLMLNAAALAGLLWFAVRMSLASAAAVAGRRLGVGPSWEASKGSAARLFGYWLLWIVLAGALQLLLFFTLQPEQVALLKSAGTIETPEQADDLARRMNEAQLASFDFSSAPNIIRYVAMNVANAVMVVLGAAAGGVAWRYLGQDEPVQT